MEIQKITPEYFPKLLQEISDPPKQLYYKGKCPFLSNDGGNLGRHIPSNSSLIYLAVVGTRKCTIYGKEACRKIISGLAGYNFVIVSGIALGIDAVAHQAALDAKLPTIAIPGSGIDWSVFHPRTNHKLAKDILEPTTGGPAGCLMSELGPKCPAGIHTFVQRNRIIAGLCQGTLIIEAAEKSGSLITAEMAIETGRDVFAVPGSIFNENSKGTNMLIKDGAAPVHSAKDIIDFYGLNQRQSEINFEKKTDHLPLLAQKILGELKEPTTRDDLVRQLKISSSEINPLLTMLQFDGFIKDSGGEIFKT